ncbi:MAG: CBS domain-containing protein [Chloroflexia bacterium]|nr:CBS domain-containing protein [Chloroflexia bacterium]
MAADQPVTQIMTVEVLATAPDTSIAQVARTMSEKGISGLPVIDADNNLVGIITETDIISHEIQVDTPTFVPILDWIIRMPGDTSEDDLRRVLATSAGQLMTAPVYSVTVDATVREVATLMFERKVNPVPVLNHDNRVVGIISRSDIVRLIAEAEASLSES